MFAIKEIDLIDILTYMSHIKSQNAVFHVALFYAHACMLYRYAKYTYKYCIKLGLNKPEPTGQTELPFHKKVMGNPY